MLKQQNNQFKTFSDLENDKQNVHLVQSKSMKSQMSVFLSLLQKSLDSEINHNKKVQESLEQKLSTILSASQQNTSGQIINKYNHNSEKDSSCVFYEKYFQTESLEEQFIKPTVSKNMQSLLTNTMKQNSSKYLTNKKINEYQSSDKQNYNISTYINQEEFIKQCQSILSNKQLDKLKRILKNYAYELKQSNENKLNIQNGYQKMRIKNDQLSKILLYKIQEEKKMMEHIQFNKKKLQQIDDLNIKIINENKETSHELEISKKQNAYLKQLILLANKNYENLEKKYCQLQNKYISIHLKLRQTETTSQTKSSLKESILIMKSQQNRYKLVSPKRLKSSQKQNKNKQQIDQSYRKIFIKTLKSIKK